MAPVSFSSFVRSLKVIYIFLHLGQPLGSKSNLSGGAYWAMFQRYYHKRSIFQVTC